MNLFFELIEIFLGRAQEFRNAPSPKEWEMMFELAKSHYLLGVLSPALDVLPDSQRIPLVVYSKWMLSAEMIEKTNATQKTAAKELSVSFAKDGKRACVLKGAGIAAYYPRPELRHCGDIDIWVEGKREETLDYLHSFCKVGDVVYHHCDATLKDGVHTEVHFCPSWMNSSALNRRLQEFFSRNAPAQFSNFDKKLGFCVPDIRFNAVYEVVHIFRHLLYEGVRLKPFMDYYYTLLRLPASYRDECYAELERLGLASFVPAVMWLLSRVFHLDAEHMLCPPDPKMGKVLFNAVLSSENVAALGPGKRLLRLNRFFRFCPREILAAPSFRLWQYLWRKRKGYINTIK